MGKKESLVRSINAFFALILACALTIWVSHIGQVQAFAAGTYTLKLDITGQTLQQKQGYVYSAYQIFKGDLAGTGATATLGNIEWAYDVNSDALIKALAANDTTKADFAKFVDGGAVKSGTTAAEIAKAIAALNDDAKKYAVADILYNNRGAGAGTEFTPKGASVANETTELTATVASAGYYVIASTSKPTNDAHNSYSDTRYILQVTNTVTNIKPKIGTTTAEKTVIDPQKAGSAEASNNAVSAAIGQELTFNLKVDLPANIKNYADHGYKAKFSDTKSAGLDWVVKTDSTNLDYSFVVKYNDGSAKETAVTDLGNIAADSNTVELTIADVFKNPAIKKAITDNTTGAVQLVLTYKAKLNANAVVTNDGNPNNFTFEFSNNPNTGTGGDTSTTPPSIIHVHTFKVSSTKVDSQDTNTKLAGAKFKLQDITAGGTNKDKYATMTTTADGDYKISGWVASDADATEITSAAQGKLDITGLPEGTFKLIETQAPSGYEKAPMDAFEFKIAPEYVGTGAGTLTSLKITSGTAAELGTAEAQAGTVSGTEASVAQTLKNTKGSILPNTGGMGTIIFTIVGLALMIGAGATYVVRRRKQQQNA